VIAASVAAFSAGSFSFVLTEWFYSDTAVCAARKSAGENDIVQVPPGPRGLEVLGFVRRTLPFLEETARRFGPISSFRVLNQRLYLIDEPEWIQDILVTRQHLFIRDTGATLLRELVGDGLLTRDEPGHKERRRILQPAFHRTQVASYAGMMVAESVRSAEAWRPDSTLDIAAEMKRVTLAIVGASLFGADFNKGADRIAAVLERVLNRSRWIAPGLAMIEPLAQAYRRIFPRGPSLFFGAERAELERILAPVIEQRRQAQTGDILSLLLADLDDRDATNEIVTMVLAGHETTATALTWAWYLISRHPDVEACLHAEIDRVLGGRDASLDDIPRLTYTTMVFQETMRLYPPAPLFGRRPKEQVTIGGFEIASGSSILMSPYITQRNERWFARPDQFETARWQNISIPKFASFPFGGGAKMCIGESFARMEGVLVLATLAQRWRLIPVNGDGIGIRAAVTLRPDGPVWMRAQARAISRAIS
jgi:cytochrome P450